MTEFGLSTDPSPLDARVLLIFSRIASGSHCFSPDTGVRMICRICALLGFPLEFSVCWRRWCQPCGLLISNPMARASSSTGFPHPAYLQTVLKPNFEHSVRHFFQPLIEINRAHAIMLARCGIIPKSHAQRILEALKQIASQEKQLLSYRYQGVEEDLFFHLERRLEALCGSEVAGHLSVARSRNDIDITLYRMVLRKELLQTSCQVNSLQNSVAGTLQPACRHPFPRRHSHAARATNHSGALSHGCS